MAQMPTFGDSLAAPDPVLAVLEVVTPGKFSVFNYDNVPLTLIFDGGAPPASLIASLPPGGVAGPQPTFTGRVQVIGPLGAIFDATSN